MIYLSSSEEETRKIAGKLAKEFKQGAIILLVGELGVGKTVFAQGFAEGLGIKEKIISPTFVIIRPYHLAKRWFYHIDLYRLNHVDPRKIGLEDIMEEKNNLVLIEWADKLKNTPKQVIKINLRRLSDSQREISVMI